MAQADGTIIIDTEINADGMKAGSKEIEAAVRRMASLLDNLSTKAKTALNKQVNSFAKLNSEYAAQAKKVEDLKNKVAEYGSQKIPTEEYKEIQLQIDQATKRMNQLIAAQERYKSVGGKTGNSSYKKMQYDIDELANTIKYAEAELKDLEASGKAFTFGANTKQAQADMEKLAEAERKLSDMNNRLGTSYSSIKGTVNDYRNNLLKASDAQGKAYATGKKLSKSLKDTGKSAKSAQFGIGKMLGTSILFSFVFQAISGVINAMKEGFTNLAQYSGETNNSISMLWGSLETLKNSLATAFAPILNVVAPILSKFIDMLSTAASYVSMFFAFLSGKSTYTKAIAVQKDYAGSLEDTAAGASDAAGATEDAAEAAEDYLSPLDDINRMNEQSKDSGSGGGGGGAGGGSGEGPLFEEVAIDNKFASLMDTVLDKLQQIRDIFMSGFWDGLGDYKPLLNELISDLSSIGKYLTDIFTDADVQTAAKRFATSFIYNIGKIAGSFAKIGLTIAVNIVGGIESYLSENVDGVKRYLISMFNIQADVFDILGDLAASVADIFSDVFGSQVAQDLTGDIIGIFSGIFSVVSEIAASLGRDILNFIAQPIIENKGKIKTALLETIEPIESIAQSIEDFVNTLAEKVMTLYNKHIKPFIDSITEGFSQIFGTLLEGYNTYIAPILDAWASKFDEVLNGPVGDALDSLFYAIGNVLDLLKVLWESVLVPFISWLIENILPIISPIIEFLGNQVLDFFGTVGEVVSGILDILGGLIEFLVGIFTGNWDKSFSGLKKIAEGFQKSINSVFNFVQNNILKPFDNFLGKVFAVDFEKWFGVLGIPLNTFFTNVKNVWESVKKIFNGIITFIKGIFSGNWKQAWNGIVQVFKGIMSGLSSAIRSPINGIIGLVNGAISGINTLIRGANRLPGVSIPTIGRIPYLASGAVIPPNKEFLAVLGDQKSGNNIEAPESLIRKIVREESGGGSGKYEVVAKLGRKELLRIIIDEAKLQQQQTGKNPLEFA